MCELLLMIKCIGDSWKFMGTRDQALKDLSKKTAATMQHARAVLKCNTYINRMYKKEGYFHILGQIYLMRRKKLSITYPVSISGFLGSFSEISISACCYGPNPGEFHHWYSNLYTGRIQKYTGP